MAIVQEIIIPIDVEEMKRQFRQKLDDAHQEVLFTWDVNEMVKRTCMSKAYLEEEFLRDPRMKKLERRKRKGKRYWFYEPSKEVMREIMDEWD